MFKYIFSSRVLSPGREFPGDHGYPHLHHRLCAQPFCLSGPLRWGGKLLLLQLLRQWRILPALWHLRHGRRGAGGIHGRVRNYLRTKGLQWVFLHSLESCFVLKLLVWRWMYWRLLVCIIDKWEKHESIDGTVGLHLPTGIDIECYIRALPLNKFKACVSCIIHYIMRICTPGTFCTFVLGAMTFRQFFPLHLSGCYLRPGRKFADGVVAPIDGDYLPTRTTSPMQCQARSCFVVVYSPWAKKLHKNWHFPYSTFARAMPNVISSHMKPQDMGRGFATFTLKRPWIIFSWGIW